MCRGPRRGLCRGGECSDYRCLVARGQGGQGLWFLDWQEPASPGCVRFPRTAPQKGSSGPAHWGRGGSSVELAALTLPASGGLHACMRRRFSGVRLFVTLWIVALQPPLSMGFSRQEYWSGLSCLPPGNLPDHELNLHLLSFLHLHTCWVLYH